MKLSIRSFGGACAVMAGFVTLIIGLWYSLTGYGSQIMEILSAFYANIIHFSFNPLSSIWKNLGSNILSVLLLFIFSMIDGFILGAVFSFVYNLFIAREKQ